MLLYHKRAEMPNYFCRTSRNREKFCWEYSNQNPLHKGGFDHDAGFLSSRAAKRAAARRRGRRFLLCAAVLAGAAVHASCAPEAVPAAANALVAGTDGVHLTISQDGEVIVTTAIDVRTLPGADREALERGIPLENEQALTQLLEDYS